MPSIVASPLVGSSSVARMRMVVVFPAPFGPTKPMTSPPEKENDTPSSAVVRPKSFRSPLTSTRIRSSGHESHHHAVCGDLRRLLQRRLDERRVVEQRDVGAGAQIVRRLV